MANADQPVQRKELFGHPVGLYILFFTELWERFSYYGMRAILTYYMISSATGNNPGLGWDNSKALAIYGWYTMLVYVMSIPGGIIADKLFGQKRTVLLGGLVLVAGHAILAVDAVWAFYTGLVLVVLGVGGLKPNISTMVGGLYPGRDERRDQGFTIFYIGINVGALLAGLFVGTIGEVYGWHYGFGLAGIGMAIAQIIYWWGQRFLEGVGEAPGKLTSGTSSVPNEDKTETNAKDDDNTSFGTLLRNLFKSPVQLVISLFIIALGAVGSFYFNSGANAYAYTALSVFLGIVAGVLMMIYKDVNKIEKDRFLVILIACLITIAFWGAFEQAGGLLSIYTRDKIDRVVSIYILDGIFIAAILGLLIKAIIDTRNKKKDIARLFYILFVVLFGIYLALRFTAFANPYEIPAAVFQSVNPLFIIIFGTPVAAFWIWWKKKGRENSSLFKMAIGTIIMGIGFLFMAQASAMVQEHGDKAALILLILAYLFHTIGELSSSPVALSFVTKIAPVKYVSIMMGIYFAATGLGNKLAGAIGESAQSEPIEVELSADPGSLVADSIYQQGENFTVKGDIFIEDDQVYLQKGDDNLREIAELDEKDVSLVRESFDAFGQPTGKPLTAVIRYEYDAKAKQKLDEGAAEVQVSEYSGELEIFEIQDEREFWTFVSIFGFTAAFGLLLLAFLRKLKKLTHGAEDTGGKEEKKE